MSKQVELKERVAAKLNSYDPDFFDDIIFEDLAQEIIDLIVNDMISKLQAEIKG